MRISFAIGKASVTKNDKLNLWYLLNKWRRGGLGVSFTHTKTPNFPPKNWDEAIYTTFNRYGPKSVRLVIKSLGSVT